MANMNSAQIAQYIQQNYSGLGNLTPAQIGNIMNNSGGGNAAQIDQAITASPQYQQYTQQQAQQQYQQGINTAVGGLQTQQSNLAGQYGSLLQTVTGEYQPLINQGITMQNAQNASRGLLSNAGNGGTQMLSALNPIYSSEAGNAQTIGAGSIADMNTLQQAISSTQAGAAGTAMGIPLQFGSLALSQQLIPSQVSQNLAAAANYNASASAAKYIPVSSGENLFNSSSGNAVSMLQALAQQMGYNVTP